MNYVYVQYVFFTLLFLNLLLYFHFFDSFVINRSEQTYLKRCKVTPLNQIYEELFLIQNTKLSFSTKISILQHTKARVVDD